MIFSEKLLVSPHTVIYSAQFSDFEMGLIFKLQRIVLYVLVRGLELAILSH